MFRGGVKITKTFTSLVGYNVIKASEIFRAKENINKIPIVNEKGELIGDYSRWDDMLYIERNRVQFMHEETLKRVLGLYESVYVIEPMDDGLKYAAYLSLIKYLEDFQVKYSILDKAEVGEKLLEKAVCIFVDEDERRSVQCLYRIELYEYDIQANTRYKVRLATIKSLISQVMWEKQFERLKMKKPAGWRYDRIDDKATILLSALRQRGIKCFCLYNSENESIGLTEYRKNFWNEISKRMEIAPFDLIEETFGASMENKEEFYGELYQLEDYNKHIAQKEISQGIKMYEFRKSIVGKYFNSINGKRMTCFWPEKYIGTIYLLGPCMITGAYVEDKYTIDSYLQKKLLEKGYPYRVINYGAMIREDSEIERRLTEIDEYCMNDIVIYMSRIGSAIDIPGRSLIKIFEEHQVSSKWVVDNCMHCNHKVNSLVSDSIFEMIEACLLNEVAENNVSRTIQIDFHAVMGEYIQNKYLKQYFMNFSGEEYSTVGAIIMNCNPFSKGHRYLIEYASTRVEMLIIFAVEEDESLFSFEERFKLIVEGVKDLSNIMVVPSGNFILSRNNFWEYFGKDESESVEYNAEYDVNIFADYIAGPLHITHRFVGNEPEDKVTRIYNEAMKRILPGKGINYVEIPRMETEGEIVSASKVRKYLKDEEYEKAFELLPETTKKYLMKQL